MFIAHHSSQQLFQLLLFVLLSHLGDPFQRVLHILHYKDDTSAKRTPKDTTLLSPIPHHTTQHNSNNKIQYNAQFVWVSASHWTLITPRTNPQSWPQCTMLAVKASS